MLYVNSLFIRPSGCDCGLEVNGIDVSHCPVKSMSHRCGCNRIGCDPIKRMVVATDDWHRGLDCVLYSPLRDGRWELTSTGRQHSGCNRGPPYLGARPEQHLARISGLVGKLIVRE